MPSRPKRILILRYRFIGDTLLTVPFLRNLRRAEPDAYIVWVAAPISSDIVRGIPYVNELIYWDPPTIHADTRGTHRTLRSKWRFLRDLRARQFDKVYVLKRSFFSAVMALLTGASERIGFNTEGRAFLLTKRVPYRDDQHEVVNLLQVLRTDGVPVTDDHLELWTAPEEAEVARKLLLTEGVGAGEELVAIHPFSAIVERGWPLENFAELCVHLVAKGYRPVILGGSRDQTQFESVRPLFGDRAVNLVGKSSIRETAALLRAASLFIGNDSGIMHVAAAVGLPLVTIFGPQSPLKFGPWSKKARVMYKNFPCSPCRQKFFTECQPSARMRPFCVEEITVSEVLRESLELLSFREDR